MGWAPGWSEGVLSLWFRGRKTKNLFLYAGQYDLSLAHGEVMNEVFQTRDLVFCQRFKLHTASPHAYWSEGDFVGPHVRDSLKRQIIQIKTAFGQEDVQPA